MNITLTGGPCNGQTWDIPKPLYDHGVLRINVAPEPLYATPEPGMTPTAITPRLAIYERRRNEWLCTSTPEGTP